MAADDQRLGVIDEIRQAGTPIDGEDEMFGRQALQLAAPPRGTGADALRREFSSRPATRRSTT